jgi:membrane associated rhomboid family serine protease
MLEPDPRKPAGAGGPDAPHGEPPPPSADPAAPLQQPGAGPLAILRAAPATVLFLAICVVVFAIAESQGDTTEVATLIRFGATERGHVWSGEVWRLVTAGFLHIGFAHLVWNVVGIFSWSAPVERALGSARFAAVYLGSLVTASAASLLFHDVVSAGASGAGFGVVGATLAIGRRRLGSWRAFAAHPQVRRVVGSALVWTLVLAWMNVDHAAHAGGFVAGAALAWAFTAPAGATSGARRIAWTAAVLLVAVPVALALVPRAGLSRHGAGALDVELYQALQREDLDAAERLLARADEAGHRSPWIEYSRALVLQGRGDVEGAARILEELARSDVPEIRQNAARAARALLAERLLGGLGMPADPARGRRLVEEGCSEGEQHMCEWLRSHPEAGASGEPAGGGDAGGAAR